MIEHFSLIFLFVFFTVFSDGSRSVKVEELKAFSPWLAKFHHSQSDETIKIPGLFDNLCKPNVDSHAKIISFNPTVRKFKLAHYFGTKMISRLFFVL